MKIGDSTETIWACIDSGCSKSLIDVSVYDRLNKELGGLELKKSKSKWTAADGKEIECIGYFEQPIHLGQETELVNTKIAVLKGVDQCLFGLDVLVRIMKHAGSFEITRENCEAENKNDDDEPVFIMKIGNKNGENVENILLKLEEADDEKVQQVKLKSNEIFNKDDVVILPGKEISMPIYVETGDFDNEKALIKLDKDLGLELVGSTLQKRCYKIVNNETTIEVKNESNRILQIKKSSKIGNAKEIGPQNIGMLNRKDKIILEDYYQNYEHLMKDIKETKMENIKGIKYQLEYEDYKDLGKIHNFENDEEEQPEGERKLKKEFEIQHQGVDGITRSFKVLHEIEDDEVERKFKKLCQKYLPGSRFLLDTSEFSFFV